MRILHESKFSMNGLGAPFVRVLIFADDQGISSIALHFGVGFTGPKDVTLRVLSARCGPEEAEAPPPLGEPVPSQHWFSLPGGIRVLAQAMRGLVDMGFVNPQPDILIRETHHGYAFCGQTRSGAKVEFIEDFGKVDDVVNHYVEQDPKNLVIMAPPRRKGLEHVCVGETARRLVTDLNTSILVARGGSIHSRLLICVDGSRSAHQLFPVLDELLPVVETPVDLLWVQHPDAREDEVRMALDFMTWTRGWLEDRNKNGENIFVKSASPVDRK